MNRKPISLAIAMVVSAAAPMALAQEPEVVELEKLEVRILPQGGTAMDSTQPVEVLAGEALDDKKEAGHERHEL